MKVVICGASRGIGKAIALNYARQGASIFLMARNEENLKALSNEVNSLGGKSNYITCDVSISDDMQKAFKAAHEFLKTIDIVYLNAAIAGSDSMVKLNSEDFWSIFNINVKGLVLGLENCIPILKEQGYGKIIGISSLTDSYGFPGSAAYSSSKAAVTHILQSARIELAAHNIDVFTCRPGFVKTDMTDRNKFHMPFLMTVDKAAEYIINKVERRKLYFSFPWQMELIIRISKKLPRSIFENYMKKWYKNNQK